jgi:hypothetical protein
MISQISLMQPSLSDEQRQLYNQPIHQSSTNISFILMLAKIEGNDSPLQFVEHEWVIETPGYLLFHITKATTAEVMIIESNSDSCHGKFTCHKVLHGMTVNIKQLRRNLNSTITQ